MKKAIFTCGLAVIAAAALLSISGSPRLSGQTSAAGATTAPAQSPAAHEVWMALRSDGKAGAGRQDDPFDASSVQKFNALFERFANEYGENLAIHIGPGVFYGDRFTWPHNHWKIRGAGRDITILRTRPDPNATETVGFYANDDGGKSPLVGIEISDMTIDFNTQNLRKANRAFVYARGGKPVVSYWYAQSLPEWSDKPLYRLGYSGAVTHKGSEYVCADASQPGKEPAQGPMWSILRPCDPGKLPAWEKDTTYALGDAVSLGGKGYMCVAANTKTRPPGDAANWHAIRTDALDPHIYTHAVFLACSSPSGHHSVQRVKAINGYGSGFLSREDFVIGLGGDDCTIEDCQVSDFQDDSYATLIVLMSGHNGAVRHCSVRCDDGYNMNAQAYGGWACQDATFEGNFSNNAGTGSNIDSLENRNVTFRGNTFLNCRYVGILVNVAGGKASDPVYTWHVDGKEIHIPIATCDGLFIHDNLVTLREDCPYGGIQVQQDGLSNVKIYNNVIRTPDGKGHGRRAIGVWGKAANVQVSDNTCDPDMQCEIAPPGVFGWGNVDLAGKPIKGLDKLVKPGQ